MGKKILTALLMLAMVSLGFASLATIMFPLSIDVQDHPQYAKPMHVNVHGGFYGKAENISLDIALSEGLELLKGDLHLTKDSAINYAYSDELILQINHPGTYEVRATINVSKWENPIHYSGKFPLIDATMFYASEDTVLAFRNRSEMEQAIRDSLVFPGVATRRYQEQNDQQYFRARAKFNDIPYTISSDLASVVISLSLMSDSIPKSKLSVFYDSNQVALIRKYSLLYAPPRYDRIEYALSLDFMDRITKEQLQSMVILVTKQITELYELDQKILRMNPSDERNKFLQERAVMLKKQTAERQAIITPEPPTPH